MQVDAADGKAIEWRVATKPAMDKIHDLLDADPGLKK